jgi:hypothetical protein
MVKATHVIVPKSLDKLGDNILVYLTLPQSTISLIDNLVLLEKILFRGLFGTVIFYLLSCQRKK